MRPWDVALRPYEPAWARAFEREAERLRRALREDAVAVEHIGSTAVPGLDAKPIVDIQLGVRSLAAIEARVDDLAALGYEYVPAYDAALPERRFFRRADPATGERTHHVHACVPGTPFWQRHVRFRDALRAEPDLARAYAVLKRDLAQRFPDDPDAYTRGKTDFIVGVLARGT